jgi:L-lactate dehydrogenase complex protein LldG
MSAARQEVLARIRRALADVPGGEGVEDVAVARAYRRRDARPAKALLAVLEERLRDYGADVEIIPAAEVREAIARACAAMALRRVVVPVGLPAQWLPGGVAVIEDQGLSAAELDGVDGTVTGCAAAVAETGTLVLDGQGACGRRAITLVPDHHICVVRAEQIVGSVPEAIATVRDSVRDARRPVTLISGPSATSDIELTRVEGVHGPRHLRVLVLR